MSRTYRSQSSLPAVLIDTNVRQALSLDMKLIPANLISEIFSESGETDSTSLVFCGPLVMFLPM